MPVIAYGKGGAAEMVLDGKTGILFSDQTEAGMTEAVLRFESTKFNNKAASENAARLSFERFRQESSTYIENHRKS